MAESNRNVGENDQEPVATSSSELRAESVTESNRDVGRDAREAATAASSSQSNPSLKEIVDQVAGTFEQLLIKRLETQKEEITKAQKEGFKAQKEEIKAQKEEITKAQKEGFKAQKEEIKAQKEEITKAQKEEFKAQKEEIKAQKEEITKALKEEFKAETDRISKQLDRLTRATPRAAAPEAGFVVDVGVEEVMQKSLVCGGEATWTILKREECYYGVSSLHAAIPYESKVAGELFVYIPFALRNLVDAAGFVMGNDKGDTEDVEDDSSRRQDLKVLENGSLVAQGDTQIHRDIVFLRLKSNPVTNSVIWHDDTDHISTKAIDCVAGYSHSQMVTGFNAKFWKAKGSNEGCYVFMLESGERGNSGTLMFPFPGDKAGGTAEDDSAPRPLGVFYGGRRMDS